MRYGLALLDVEKPGRYEGVEAGAIVKDWDSTPLRFALCFPDVYEIGMSHLGLPILYEILNRMDGVLAERTYAPWGDMEALLRAKRWPLVTRESGRALGEFDLVGFTLQYELAATNVLAMLELGRVPLAARERSEGDPIVIGGGPVAANPEPLADFFDAFFVGEGEEALGEIARAVSGAKQAGADRAARIRALGTVAGVYVPSQTTPCSEQDAGAGFDPPVRVRRRVLAELEGAAVPRRPLTPFISPVHERLAVEVARGCTRGCRFCQAGFLSRPVRERSPDAIRRQVAEGLAASGYNEVGLLSLSTGDYSSIGPLLASLMHAHCGDRVSVSLPSLRADSLEQNLLEEVARVRKTGFTIAPEAGTERLRRVINKNVTDEEIVTAAERVFAAGWKALKLYFMVGLPTETRDDWEGIVNLAQEVARRATGGRGRVVVSVSNFVPKPHTAFQWCRQADGREIREAQGFFKHHLKGKRIDFKWHNADMSVLEGVLARGDRRLGAAILGAYRRGCRMDGWTDEFRWEPWREALVEAGLTAEEFLRERSLNETLPWDVVDVGVDRLYLVEEWEKSAREEATEDCRDGRCRGCGLCDFDTVLPRVSTPEAFPERPQPVPDSEQPDPAKAPRLRFRFRKTGPAGFLSHLETVAALHRALCAAGIRVLYSQGFNPHPKITLGPALRLGTESLDELGDVRLWELPGLVEARRRINANLPEGLRVTSVWEIPATTRGITGGGCREEYRVRPSPEAGCAARNRGGWKAIIEGFRSSPGFPVVKRRVNKADRVLEAHEFVESVRTVEDELEIRMLRRTDGTTLGPEEFLRHLSGLTEGVRACARILKTRCDSL